MKNPNVKNPTVAKPKAGIRIADRAPKKKTIKMPRPEPVAEHIPEKLPETKVKPSAPPVRNEPDSDSEAHGQAYVRMLNTFGLIRPVTVAYVPDRLCDGYHFIADEPSIPRYLGEPEVPDGEKEKGFVVRAVLHPIPKSTHEALALWLRRMEDDRMRFEGHDQLLFKFITTVRRRLDREMDKIGMNRADDDE